MRILVLDDDDQRHAFFKRQLIGHDVVHTHSYKECMDALRGKRFDMVFLDHDLNMNQYSSKADDRPEYIQRNLTQFSKKGELDGRDVTEDMIKMLPKEKIPETVVVHSWNPSGAAEMVKMLQDANYPHVIRWPFDPKATLKVKNG